MNCDTEIEKLVSWKLRTSGITFFFFFFLSFFFFFFFLSSSLSEEDEEEELSELESCGKTNVFKTKKS